MDDPVGSRRTAQFFGVESSLQEGDHRFGAQRMQIRLHIRSAFPLVVALASGGDIPEVAGAVFYCRRTLTIGLIDRPVNRRRACLQRALVNRIAIANVNVESPQVRITSPGQTRSAAAD